MGFIWYFLKKLGSFLLGLLFFAVFIALFVGAGKLIAIWPWSLVGFAFIGLAIWVFLEYPTYLEEKKNAGSPDKD